MKKSKKRSARRTLGRLLGALLAALLVALGAFTVIPLTERGDRSAADGSADWMAALDDSKRLNELALPGSHDSATQYVQLAFFSKCQALSVGEQLEAGCRYLDIRLGLDGRSGSFQLMHGFTRCKPSALGFDALYLDDMLRECYAFLAAHPTETVVFAVKQEHGDESVEEFERALDAYLLEHPDYWLLTDTIPTLGEARGKLVLMRRYEDAASLGARAGIPLLWEDQKGCEDTALNTVSADQGSYVLWVQDRFEYDVADKWAAFCEGMVTARGAIDASPKDGLAIHFLSTKGTGTYGHPWYYARLLDPQLVTLGKPDGWIVMDFLSARLAEYVYLTNFR